MTDDIKNTSKAFRENIYSNYGKIFQDVGEYFDTDAAYRWGKAYNWYLRGWLPKSKEAQIGDLGCGNGKLLHFLKDLGYVNLIGVDIASDQVTLARQVVPNIVQTDVLEWLSKQDSKFEYLISLDLIEHLQKDEALYFLDLALNALKPGGRLVLKTPNADSPFGMNVRYGDPTHEWAFNVNQLSRLMKRVGFSDIEFREQGPVPWGYSLVSTSRWFIWQLIRMGLQIWNIAETGSALPVLTRVFLASGCKR